MKGIRKKYESHNASYTRLYQIWDGMRRRTADASRKEFAHYGAKGVTVCPEWRESFCAFREWAQSSGYREGLMLERIHKDGDYAPDNCRWSSKADVENNKSSNVMLTVNGITKSASEWAREMGVTSNQIRKRKRRGWSDDQAVMTPARQKRSDSSGEEKQSE